MELGGIGIVGFGCTSKGRGLTHYGEVQKRGWGKNQRTQFIDREAYSAGKSFTKWTWSWNHWDVDCLNWTR